MKGFSLKIASDTTCVSEIFLLLGLIALLLGAWVHGSRRSNVLGSTPGPGISFSHFGFLFKLAENAS